MPRYKDVILLGDLIDCARPGEEIDVTGIYVHNQHTLSKDKTGFPVFSTGTVRRSVGWSMYIPFEFMLVLDIFERHAINKWMDNLQ